MPKLGILLFGYVIEIGFGFLTLRNVRVCMFYRVGRAIEWVYLDSW